MEGPERFDAEPEQEKDLAEDSAEEEGQIKETEVEVIECTDYNEYKKVIEKLESDEFTLMYNVPNDLVKGHLDHFKNSRRFGHVKLVTVFNDPSDKQKKHKIDRNQTAIWYKY